MILKNLSPSKIFLKMGHDVIFSNSRFTAVLFDNYSQLRVHDWHNDGVFIKATKSLKIVVLTCYLSHSPKIHR